MFEYLETGKMTFLRSWTGKFSAVEHFVMEMSGRSNDVRNYQLSAHSICMYEHKESNESEPLSNALQMRTLVGLISPAIKNQARNRAMRLLNMNKRTELMKSNNSEGHNV